MTLSVQLTSELFKTLPVLLPVFRLTTSEPMCGQGSQNEFPKSLKIRASRISSNSLLFKYFKIRFFNRLYPVNSGYYFKYEHCYLKSIIYFRVPNSTSQLVQKTLIKAYFEQFSGSLDSSITALHILCSITDILSRGTGRTDHVKIS